MRESLQEIAEVTGAMHCLISTKHGAAEPLLISDQANCPRRLFLVRYVMEGVGEFSRPLFKRELTGYDCEMQLVYPTQTVGLDELQSLIESQTYGSRHVLLSRVGVRNMGTDERCLVKVIVSGDLFEKLVDLYPFAW